MSSRLLTGAIAGCLLLTAVPAEAAPSPVRFLGEQHVPNVLAFDGTTVGGLSSIDYDPRTGQYVFLSDDRSALQPARFYTARFDVTKSGVGPVTFTATHPLRRADGTTYPAQGVDPEELRADPWTGDYFWSQEGDRTATVLADPSIRVAQRDGDHVRDLPIPDNERMLPDSGPRQNLVLEGLTFAAGGTLVVSALEGPLLQDGPVATAEQGALSRITVQTRGGTVLAQYAYPQEPVFAPGAGGSTGVSSILAADPLDPSRYLVMERAFVSGVGNKVRIYEIDTHGATNVLHTASLSDAKVKPVRKKLLLDLADHPLSKVDNVEGMTWGPRLPSGERTLVLVSDDNFSANQITQVIAFAVRR
ncbi:esterase-like activity of phytase family protein [Amycolatopsis thermalba]|uniref:Esterase-like activity of phytase family protein n=1 Tax=Amycolatopsis thermalba TaxID=944492 RepID=A0ABY4NMI6_9PSEU|nr:MULTISPECIES: esterase-like activity of phytase family protein [Amycolatopsis]UQS21708.1 esterase-like activity of phytase family protein [Amycolatopsis thermalba]